MAFTILDICTLMKILSECKMSRNILDLYMAQRYTVQMYAIIYPEAGGWGGGMHYLPKFLQVNPKNTVP